MNDGGKEVAGVKKILSFVGLFLCFHLFRLKENDEVSLLLLRLLRSHIKLKLKLVRSTSFFTQNMAHKQ